GAVGGLLHIGSDISSYSIRWRVFAVDGGLYGFDPVRELMSHHQFDQVVDRGEVAVQAIACYAGPVGNGSSGQRVEPALGKNLLGSSTELFTSLCAVLSDGGGLDPRHSLLPP